jgi:hypothetical protein
MIKARLFKSILNTAQRGHVDEFGEGPIVS